MAVADLTGLAAVIHIALVLPGEPVEDEVQFEWPAS